MVDWKEMNLLARSYLDLQQTRIGCEHRLRMLEDENRKTPQTFTILTSHHAILYKQERDMLKQSGEIFRATQLWEWCERTRGLGPVAAMTFMGYINPRSAHLQARCGRTSDSSPELDSNVERRPITILS